MYDYYYLDVSLILSKNCDDHILPIFVKSGIEQSLRKVFGEIGGQLGKLDLLKFDEKRNRLILRVFEKDYVKVRSALTLISEFQGNPCYFRVNSVSPLLPSLINTHIDF